MWYFVLYLVSKCFNFAHGKSLHSKQNVALPSLKTTQFLILHLTRVIGLWGSLILQPGHLFLSRKWARHTPQFIPHGAMRDGDCNKFMAERVGLEPLCPLVPLYSYLGLYTK